MSAEPQAESFFGIGCVFFVPFLFMATIFIGLGAKDIVQQIAFRKVAVHASGRVVALDKVSFRRKVEFHPIVRYKTAAGESIEFRCRFGYRQGLYEPEQSVDVVYDPENPANAEVDSSRSRYTVYVAPGFGLAVWLLSPAVYAAARALFRRSRAKATPER